MWGLGIFFIVLVYNKFGNNVGQDQEQDLYLFDNLKK